MAEINTDITVQFLGAAGTVTGSKYFIQTKRKTILVDCGMFQGLKELRELNWEKLPISASQVDMVLLTHGHLDHVGYLPRLMKDGFGGPIWGTAPTLDITKIILEDSARIQEEDADDANKKKYTKHSPALALYTTKDVEKTLKHFNPQPLNEWITISDDIKCRFRYNGHIIGATFIELVVGSKTIVFSGDIGRQQDLLMYPPQQPEKADVLFIESTYGNRLHASNTEEHLISVINNALEKQGSIIIPSFAVERTQTLMYLLWKLKEKKAIPHIPVYLDSPMGTNVLNVFENNLTWHKLPMNECVAMCKEIKQIQTIQETYQLATTDFPKIIIAGSGMASGGRVLTYLLQYIGNPTATILLAGYQAEGTRGRALLEGATEIKLFGKYFPVKATIENIDGLSSHADQHDLIKWLDKLTTPPKHLFIVHGETDGAQGLQDKIKEVYGWDAHIPILNEVVTV